TQKYQESLATVLALDEERVKEATELLATRRQLFDEGIVSKRELEQSETALAAAQAKMDQTREQMVESDNLKTEAEAAEELAKTPPARIQVQPAGPGTYSDTGVMIRHTGSTGWSLGGLDEIQAFYAAKFGRSLPTSAVGQT